PAYVRGSWLEVQIRGRALVRLRGPVAHGRPLGQRRRRTGEAQGEPVIEARAGLVGETERDGDGAAGGVRGLVDERAGAGQEHEDAPGAAELDRRSAQGRLEAEGDIGAGDGEVEVGLGGAVGEVRAGGGVIAELDLERGQVDRGRDGAGNGG